MALGPVFAAPFALMILMAGCITHSEGTGPNDPVEAFGDGEGVITRPDGKVLLTTSIPSETTPGRNASWDLLVTHEGSAGDPPFPYSNMCHSPWQVTLQDEDGVPVRMHQGHAECLAYGTAYLEPGDELGTSWTWNVTSWDDELDRYQMLEPGAYTLEFRFERQDPDAGRAAGPTAEHRFHVA